MNQMEQDLNILKGTVQHNSNSIVTCDGCQHLMSSKGTVTVKYIDRSFVEHGGSPTVVNTKRYSPQCAPPYQIVWVWLGSNREMEFYIQKTNEHGIEALKRISV